MGEETEVGEGERWATLHQLDDWLRTPMLALSLIWLIIVVVELTGLRSGLLEIFGTAIWVIFIAEFLLRFIIAPQKAKFLRNNVLTIVALVVPAFRLFRVFAAFRAAGALRGMRLVRVVGTANRSMNALRNTLSRRGFGYVLGLTVLVAILGAAGMLSFEPAGEVQGGFGGYWDALWWTSMLISTMGSGFWPVTTEGRILTLLVSVYGFAVFGYITATFASFFIGRDADAADAEVAGTKDLLALRDEIAALREELARGRSQ
jgi:voltage-gated potassium channel